MRTRRHRALGLLAALAFAGIAAPAWSQVDIRRDPQLSAVAPSLRDFIHFTRIARFDAAGGYARQILDANLPPTKFVDLVEASGEESRFEEAIARAEKQPDLAGLAGQLRQLFTKGKMDRVRDPAEITRNIALLQGNAQNRLFARERLAAAGEYALPQLLQALLQSENLELSVQAGNLLVDMQSQAIIPLCTALSGLDPIAQVKVIDVLGRISYKTSAPFLADVRSTTSSDTVKEACNRALERLGITETSAPSLYTALGDGYYRDKAELTSFPGEAYQLLWSYDPGVGLVMTAIRTEVYHEAMAMRMAERSLTLQGTGNDAALSLWLAANFSREIDTPGNYDNPAYPATRRDAMYYAVAAGASLDQQVLARAMDDRDTPLARRAISAIEQTAGGAALWSGERRPLLEALAYPNRRVQYEAALALGSAMPSAAFEGSDRVVPILGSAIRDAGDRYAVVVTGDQERYQVLRKLLTDQGYTVLPYARTMQDLAQPISEAPGIDVILSDLNSMDETAAVISAARAGRSTAVTPIVAMTSSQGYIELGRQFGRDVTVAIRPQGLPEATIGEAVKDLVESASGGPITDEEARGYMARSLAVLRDLALSGNTVYSVGDAALPLIAALGATQGQVRLDVAEVLAHVDQKRTQVALMDAALNAAGAERIALLEKVADSAKRYGNRLEPRQVERVLEIASNGTGGEATAAAALVGALSLPNDNLIPLILGRSG